MEIKFKKTCKHIKVLNCAEAFCANCGKKFLKKKRPSGRTPKFSTQVIRRSNAKTCCMKCSKDYIQTKVKEDRLKRKQKQEKKE